ncbi:amine sulfotransferase-like [Arapaima gigas]
MAQQEYKLLSDQLFTYKGMVFPIIETHDISKEYIDSLEHFEIRDSDVFLVTFPKSGTVWTQRIITLLHDDDFPEEVDLTTIDRMPWLEILEKGKDYNSRPSPRLFCSHLLEHLVPRGLCNKKAKVIYVSRNPKDILVSYHHFCKFMRTLEQHKDMEETFDKFLCGWSEYYCTLTICELLTALEDCRGFTWSEDLRSAVVKIIEFLGKSLSDAAIDKIVERVTFKNMKSDPKANYENMSDDVAIKNAGTFLRKGTTGDWKNFLTVSQNERFDKVFQERMKDLPLTFKWDINEING